MSNGVTDLANLIPEIMSPKLYAELRNSLIFMNTFSREYEGEIKSMGDTVLINQIVAPTGEILTDDKQMFASQTMTVNRVTLVANKRASAAFEFTDLAQLQSMQFQADALEALRYAITLKAESDVIAGLIPSSSSPDHIIAPASGDLAAVDLGTLRTLMSIAKIPRAGRRFIGDPTYIGNLLNANTVISSDYQAANSAQDGLVTKFAGFDIYESDLLGTDVGYAVHPSAMQLVMQQDVRIKISDLHASGKYGYVMSADFVYGWVLADNKRIVKISG